MFKQEGVVMTKASVASCPCCGGEAVLDSFTVRKGYEANVHCNGGCLLSMQTITCDTLEEAEGAALSAWNHRAAYDKTLPARLFTEIAKWDALCTKIAEVISSSKDCEDHCWQGFLELVNSIRSYDGQYDRELQAEKYRADVAEEALLLASDAMWCVDCMCHLECQKDECISLDEEKRTKCISDYFKREAEARLREKK